MSRIAIPVALLGAIAFVVLAVLAAPLGAEATDGPHGHGWGAQNLGQQGYDCEACHKSHISGGSAGSGLTTGVNAALCNNTACHGQNNGNFGFTWPNADEAQYTGTTGVSHSWSALATNGGASLPDPSSATTWVRDMSKHLDSGTKLKCSTCHDVHRAPQYGQLHVSTTSLPMSSGTVTLTTNAGSKALAFVIKMPTATTFKISFDSGVNWWGYASGTKTWNYDTYAGYASGRSTTTPAYLPDPVGISTTTAVESASCTTNTCSYLTFSTSSGAYQTLPVYVSYPFLRGDSSTMCITCHKDRNQSSANVEGTPGTLKGNGQAIVLGSSVFHHPVGQPLAQTYDRTGGTAPNFSIIDADGYLQPSVLDNNATNDLPTDSSGNVNCLTCHYPHGADSNSLSVDPR